MNPDFQLTIQLQNGLPLSQMKMHLLSKYTNCNFSEFSYLCNRDIGSLQGSRAIGQCGSGSAAVDICYLKDAKSRRQHNFAYDSAPMYSQRESQHVIS